MTRDEIQALPAGRELDALIVQQVFGWKPRHDPVKGDFYEHPAGYPIAPWAVPPYSTDIAKAWQLIEHLRERGIIVRVGPYLPGRSAAYWSTAPQYYTCGAPDVVADSAPLAICRIALLILEP